MNSCHFRQHGWTQRVLCCEISQTERQIPYDFTMWNLKNQTNEQTNNRNRLLHTENKLIVAKGERIRGMEKIFKWSTLYFLPYQLCDLLEVLKYIYQTFKISQKKSIFYTCVVIIILQKKQILSHCALDCDDCYVCLFTQNTHQLKDKHYLQYLANFRRGKL